MHFFAITLWSFFFSPTTASTGHAFTQAPQPVQLSMLITGVEIPPARGGIIMARGSQGSKQLRHSTPWWAMQTLLLTEALIDQGVRWLFFSKACGLQASTHCSQNKHSPDEKSTTGKFARASLIMFVGHCEIHSPQLVQMLVNKRSEIAHGGLNGDSFPLKSPRRNCILLTCAFIKVSLNLKLTFWLVYGEWRICIWLKSNNNHMSINIRPKLIYLIHSNQLFIVAS